MVKIIRYALLLFCTVIALLVIERLTTAPTTDEERNLAEFVASKKTVAPYPPNEFYEDGCTLWPDVVLWHDLSRSCLLHDIDYWQGGDEALRLQADEDLKDRVSATGTLGPVIAEAMYWGVRAFGDSYLARTFGANWGYGWNE